MTQVVDLRLHRTSACSDCSKSVQLTVTISLCLCLSFLSRSLARSHSLSFLSASGRFAALLPSRHRGRCAAVPSRHRGRVAAVPSRHRGRFAAVPSRHRRGPPRWRDGAKKTTGGNARDSISRVLLLTQRIIIIIIKSYTTLYYTIL